MKIDLFTTYGEGTDKEQEQQCLYLKKDEEGIENHVVNLYPEVKIGCIIVKDLSRFGRNYLEAGDYHDFRAIVKAAKITLLPNSIT